jgi:hypothetical protein
MFSYSVGSKFASIVESMRISGMLATPTPSKNSIRVSSEPPCRYTVRPQNLKLLTGVLEVTATFIGVFCEVRTEYLKLTWHKAFKNRSPFPKLCGCRRVIPKKTGRSPEVHIITSI